MNNDFELPAAASEYEVYEHTMKQATALAEAATASRPEAIAVLGQAAGHFLELQARPVSLDTLYGAALCTEALDKPDFADQRLPGLHAVLHTAFGNLHLKHVFEQPQEDDHAADVLQQARRHYAAAVGHIIAMRQQGYEASLTDAQEVGAWQRIVRIDQLLGDKRDAKRDAMQLAKAEARLALSAGND